MTGPVRLPANQPPRFYRGGASIATLRRTAAGGEFEPEDWVASCTTVFGESTAGLSMLPDGSRLRDAVADQPQHWLGPEHVRRFGADPALLVKLLDAGQRLPVHCHPSDAFASAHLHSRYGKTEAWVVAGATGPDPSVYIGFANDVDEATAADWVRRQDSAALLAALNTVPVSEGDTVFVPAGVPHAIGPGVFIVELQQPTDFSVMLEWTGFLPGPDGHLGLGYPSALDCLDRSAVTGDRLLDLVHRGGRGDIDLFGPEAARFFRAQWLTGAGHRLDRSYAVLVVLSGTGVLDTEHAGRFELAAGDTVVVPYAAGPGTLHGDLVAVRCLPPDPDVPGDAR